MVVNQELGRRGFFGGSEETSPLPPSKGEMRRASIHEQYDVGTGGRLGRKHPPCPLQRGRCDGQADTNNMM